MTLRSWALVLLGALPLAACATVKEVESDQPSGASVGEDMTDPAAREGQYQLDSDLCWESVDSPTASQEALQQAHDECMRQKGWGREP